MRLFLSRLIVAVTCCFGCFCNQGNAATIFYDDFNDGDPLDANPVSWIQDDEPDDVMTIMDGDLVIAAGGSIYAGYGFASPQGVTVTSVSIRAQARCGPGDVVSLGARVDEPLTGGVPSGGYYARITEEGEVVMGGFGEYLGSEPFPTEFRPGQEDVVMQFDIIGEQLSFWVWRPGENMPSEPLIAATDNRDNSGVIGLSVWNWPWSNAPTEATFRYAQVADVHIHPGDFTNDGWIDNHDLLAWKLGFGTSSGAAPDDGDADYDGDVDSRDFLMWQRAYGTVSPLAAITTDVPEPSSLALTLTVFCLALRRRR